MSDTDIEQRYINKLKESQEGCGGDPEAAHGAGEEIMLELLREAGFGFFASEYEKASENWWYT